tara:strand:- start:130 stop:987 length:858 start_codon:yes stop_codon:yes gene_type:complete
MIISKDEQLEYLYAFKDGKIKRGLEIGNELDNWYVHKRGTFTVVVGLDNVGKTNFLLWYFLCLSVKHKIKWCIWSGENSAGQLTRDLIQMYAQTKIADLTKSKIQEYNNEISKWFTFVSNKKMYNHKELLKIFKESNCNAGVIDPFTGLNHDRRVNQYERNYLICNDIREFCNTTKKAIYLMTHPMTEAARRVYPPNHEFSGYIQPPRKSDVEGGQVFANRCDSFLSIHRFINSPENWMTTQVRVEKIKDKETGGTPTLTDCLSFDYNYGLGFTIGGINVLKQKQ